MTHKYCTALNNISKEWLEIKLYFITFNPSLTWYYLPQKYSFDSSDCNCNWNLLWEGQTSEIPIFLILAEVGGVTCNEPLYKRYCSHSTAYAVTNLYPMPCIVKIYLNSVKHKESSQIIHKKIFPCNICIILFSTFNPKSSARASSYKSICFSHMKILFVQEKSRWSVIEYHKSNQYIPAVNKLLIGSQCNSCSIPDEDVYYVLKRIKKKKKKHKQRMYF